MNKTVLYIGGFILPDKNAAAQRVIANSKIFKELGYNVSLVGLSHETSGCDVTFEYAGFNCVNLKYPKSAKEWYNYLFTICLYKKYIDKIKPEIIIAYNHPAVSLKKLLKYDKARGIKTLTDCTEWYEPEGNVFFKTLKKWDVNYRMTRVQPSLDGIIVISRFLESYYNGSKTLLLPPLVDKKEEKWKIEPVAEERLNLIYAGSTSKQKDRLDIIINLLSKICEKEKIDLSFKILGLSKEQYVTIYNPSDQLPEFVVFKGRVCHTEVIRELKSSDFQIFFRPNNLVNTAGFPTKFVETISAKCLALTNRSSNLDDYLVEGENGFWIDQANEDSIYSSLLKALLIPKDELIRIKNSINDDIFDYRNYVEKTKMFIEMI